MDSNSAQTFINNNFSPRQGGNFILSLKKNSLKLVFIILGIIIIVELFLAVKKIFFSKQVILNRQISRSVALPGAEIDVISPKNRFKVGEVIPVTVNVFTGGHFSDGADLILHFDPKVLDASSGATVKGQAYPEYPVSLVDNKKGLIKVSGIVGVNQRSFSGLADLVKINFRAKAPGKTKVWVDFTPGLTSDSNITETSSNKDILEKVVNLEVNIQ